MNGMYYILVDKKPVAVDSEKYYEWDKAQWQKGIDASSEKIVKRTHVGEILVSTVFLGLNHNYGDGPPILFETMIFGGPLDQEGYRYATWDQAEAGHEKYVALVKENPITTEQE